MFVKLEVHKVYNRCGVILDKSVINSQSVNGFSTGDKDIKYLLNIAQPANFLAGPGYSNFK
jgi:hypothetical protein